jgi:uncharacterized membrane protein YcjF (UPF0283 family)
MFKYIVPCSDLKEARLIQTRLQSNSSSLVYSRILRKPNELDLFNAHVLRSEDEEFAVGVLAFEMPLSQNDDWQRSWLSTSHWLAVSISMIVISVALVMQQLQKHSILPVSSTLTVTVMLSAAILILGFTGWQTYQSFRKETRAYKRAKAWLKKGKPVVIAACDELPDLKVPLPKTALLIDDHKPRAHKKVA